MTARFTLVKVLRTSTIALRRAGSNARSVGGCGRGGLDSTIPHKDWALITSAEKCRGSCARCLADKQGTRTLGKSTPSGSPIRTRDLSLSRHPGTMMSRVMTRAASGTETVVLGRGATGAKAWWAEAPATLSSGVTCETMGLGERISRRQSSPIEDVVGTRIVRSSTTKSVRTIGERGAEASGRIHLL